MHGPTYLYSGPGAWPLDVDQTHAMLEAYIDPRGIKRVESLMDVNGKTRLIAISGGNASSIVPQTNQARLKILECLKSGGGFLGICAGAIATGKIWITKPSTMKLAANEGVGILYSDGQLCSPELDRVEAFDGYVYPGKVIAPHVVKNHNPESPDNLCAVNVSDGKETFKAFHYSGPVFPSLLPESKVLLRYTDPLELYQFTSIFDRSFGAQCYNLAGPKIEEKSPVAAFSYPVGKGKVVFSGVHLEINPYTFSEAAKQHNFETQLPEELKQSNESRLRFVHSIFRELNVIT